MKDDDKKRFGAFAEQLAAEHFLREGYVVRERNWRPHNTHLEIDLICELDREMVFVEVKARSRNGEDPVEAVDVAKQKKMSRAADIYLRMQPYDYYYRFDIVAVTGDCDDWTFEHIPDAFIPPLSNR